VSEKEYDDSNRGALFKNDKKETERHPDYKGNINVAGVDYWLSAWLKESKAGKKYMSLSVQPKEQQTAPAPSKAAVDAGFNDDLPF
jgi:uncharacterized protein (DUF736 family)